METRDGLVGPVFWYREHFTEIVFTHGVRAGVRMGGQREKVCLGCISETVRCRKLILGRDIG